MKFLGKDRHDVFHHVCFWLRGEKSFPNKDHPPQKNIKN